MAIEPLSSVIAYQAQTLQQSFQTQKISPENTDVSAKEIPSPVDATTISVNRVDERNSSEENQQGQQNQQQPNNEQIKKAVEQMNKKMLNSEVLFGIHEATNRVTIKIVDKETKEVIKELPPEKTLDMIAKAWELAGLLVDEKR